MYQAKFKVGDKVVRKLEQRDGKWYQFMGQYANGPVTISEIAHYTHEFKLKEASSNYSWCPDYFDLYVEENCTENKKHKHYDLIVAWASGAEIQVFMKAEQVWSDVKTPAWFEGYEYRIKPEKKVIKIKYRIVLFGDTETVWTNITNNTDVASEFEESKYFIKWLTDWIEVTHEVEDK